MDQEEKKKNKKDEKAEKERTQPLSVEEVRELFAEIRY